MIVYVVTHGQYSDYHIEAVFHDKEQAELYCATHNMDADAEIEEFDTEEYTFNKALPIFSKWEFEIYERYPERMQRKAVCLTTEKKNNVEKRETCVGKYIRITVTLAKGATEEQARKAAYDRYMEWKYENLASFNGL